MDKMEYCYINDQMKVRPATKNHPAKDYHIDSGNYFKTRAEAEEMLKKFKKLLKSKNKDENT